MLIVLGYVVADSEGRYMVWSQRMGFHYQRPYQIEPHVFNKEAQAAQHNQVYGSIGEVNPVYIELKASDDPTDYISVEACIANNI